MLGFRVDHVRRHQEHRRAKGHRFEIHEPEEVEEEQVLNQPLLLHEEPLLEPADPAVLVEDVRGLYLHGQAQAEVLL